MRPASLRLGLSLALIAGAQSIAAADQPVRTQGGLVSGVASADRVALWKQFYIDQQTH